jgi:hypothetical protein
MAPRCREKDLNGREAVPLYYCMFSIEVFLGFLRPRRTLPGRGVERIEIIDLESPPKSIPICGADLPNGSARTENFHGGEEREPEFLPTRLGEDPKLFPANPLEAACCFRKQVDRYWMDSYR